MEGKSKSKVYVFHDIYSLPFLPLTNGVGLVYHALREGLTATQTSKCFIQSMQDITSHFDVEWMVYCNDLNHIPPNIQADMQSTKVVQFHEIDSPISHYIEWVINEEQAKAEERKKRNEDIVMIMMTDNIIDYDPWCKHAIVIAAEAHTEFNVVYVTNEGDSSKLCTKATQSSFKELCLARPPLSPSQRNSFHAPPAHGSYSMHPMQSMLPSNTNPTQSSPPSTTHQQQKQHQQGKYSQYRDETSTTSNDDLEDSDIDFGEEHTHSDQEDNDIDSGDDFHATRFQSSKTSQLAKISILINPAVTRFIAKYKRTFEPLLRSVVDNIAKDVPVHMSINRKSGFILFKAPSDAIGSLKKPLQRSIDHFVSTRIITRCIMCPGGNKEILTQTVNTECKKIGAFNSVVPVKRSRNQILVCLLDRTPDKMMVTGDVLKRELEVAFEFCSGSITNVKKLQSAYLFLVTVNNAIITSSQLNEKCITYAQSARSPTLGLVRFDQVLKITDKLNLGDQWYQHVGQDGFAVVVVFEKTNTEAESAASKRKHGQLINLIKSLSNMERKLIVPTHIAIHKSLAPKCKIYASSSENGQLLTVTGTEPNVKQALSNIFSTMKNGRRQSTLPPSTIVSCTTASTTTPTLTPTPTPIKKGRRSRGGKRGKERKEGRSNDLIDLDIRINPAAGRFIFKHKDKYGDELRNCVKKGSEGMHHHVSFNPGGVVIKGSLQCREIFQKSIDQFVVAYIETCVFLCPGSESDSLKAKINEACTKVVASNTVLSTSLSTDEFLVTLVEKNINNDHISKDAIIDELDEMFGMSTGGVASCECFDSHQVLVKVDRSRVPPEEVKRICSEFAQTDSSSVLGLLRIKSVLCREQTPFLDDNCNWLEYTGCNGQIVFVAYAKGNAKASNFCEKKLPEMIDSLSSVYRTIYVQNHFNCDGIKALPLNCKHYIDEDMTGSSRGSKIKLHGTDGAVSHAVKLILDHLKITRSDKQQMTFSHDELQPYMVKCIDRYCEMKRHEHTFAHVESKSRNQLPSRFSINCTVDDKDSLIPAWCKVTFSGQNGVDNKLIEQCKTELQIIVDTFYTMKVASVSSEVMVSQTIKDVEKTASIILEYSATHGALKIFGDRASVASAHQSITTSLMVEVAEVSTSEPWMRDFFLLDHNHQFVEKVCTLICKNFPSVKAEMVQPSTTLPPTPPPTTTTTLSYSTITNAKLTSANSIIRLIVRKVQESEVVVFARNELKRLEAKINMFSNPYDKGAYKFLEEGFSAGNVNPWKTMEEIGVLCRFEDPKRSTKPERGAVQLQRTSQLPSADLIPSSKRFLWVWQLVKNRWKKFEKEHDRAIESAFLTGKEKATIQVASSDSANKSSGQHPEYEIMFGPGSRDPKQVFEGATQINTISQYKREVRRVDLAVWNEWKGREGKKERHVVEEKDKEVATHEMESFTEEKELIYFFVSGASLKDTICRIIDEYLQSQLQRDDFSDFYPYQLEELVASKEFLAMTDECGCLFHMNEQQTELHLTWLGEGKKDRIHACVVSLQHNMAKVKVPSTWVGENGNDPWSREGNFEKLRLIEVDRSTEEHSKVVELMRKGGTVSRTIRKIERVQNFVLWERYHQAKLRVRNTNDGDANEQWMFHGSRQTNPMSIAKEGFDDHFARPGMLGKGAYFADSVDYSDGYAYTITTQHSFPSSLQYSPYRSQQPSQAQQMFVARVLCGRVQEVTPSSSSQTILHPESGYHSVGGYVGRTNAIVVYRNDRAYPEYLVTYSN
eukprot:m.31804 g.31804  ORF g.31804 m.31804 type:complete len:1756 (-) comp6336_c0_seq1:1735-7002(-)